MSRTVLAIGISFAALMTAPAVAQDAPAETTDQPTAVASLVDANGDVVGSAAIRETPRGVIIRITSDGGLTEGEHGFHIHETGECDPATGFESAGGHFNPGGNTHGYLSENGPHAGDLPNQWVAADGTLDATVFNSHLTIVAGDAEAPEGRSIIASTGVKTALVVHEHPDDYQDVENGHSGGRLACGVIELSQTP